MENFEDGLNRGVDGLQAPNDGSRRTPERTTPFLGRRMEKVPLTMRQDQKSKEYFDPIVVSIGPYHYGKDELKIAQKLKPIVAELYISRSGKNMDDFRRSISQKVDDARRYYHPEGLSHELSNNDTFTDMILFDGLFFLAIMDQSTRISGQRDEILEAIDRELHKHLGPHAFFFLQSDVFLLVENQLPFEILEILMSLKSNDNSSAFTELLEKHWDIQFSLEFSQRGNVQNRTLFRNFLAIFGISISQFLHYPEYLWFQRNIVNQSFLNFVTSGGFASGTGTTIGHASGLEFFTGPVSRTSADLGSGTSAAHTSGTSMGLVSSDHVSGTETSTGQASRTFADHASATSAPHVSRTSAAHVSQTGTSIGHVSETPVGHSSGPGTSGDHGFGTSKQIFFDFFYSFRSISELKAKGIYAKRGNIRNQRWEIEFRSTSCFAVLEIPPFILNPLFITLNSNQIAHELSPNGPYMIQPTMAYINFLKCLINVAEDVKELRAKNILFSPCANDEVVVQMINSIPTIPDVLGKYEEVKESIKNHCDRKRKVWIAEFNHKYLSSPWAITALLAATALIC